MLTRWGQLELARQERQSGVVERRGAPTTSRCISNLGRAGEWDEYIVVEARQIPRSKSGGGRRPALDRLWFGRPFHPDCEYGALLAPFSNRIPINYNRYEIL
jgi:hypothetical protein